MALSLNKRQIALGLALAATLGGAAWVGEPESVEASAVEQPVPRPAAGPQVESTPGERAETITLAELKREISPESMRDVFASQSWYVPPPPPKYVAPPPPPPAPPAPPAAPPAPPPLPFAYLGKILDGGEITVFVAFNGRNIAVKANETIGSTYRIDAIGPRSMVLTYLPLDMKQTLSLGERN